MRKVILIAVLTGSIFAAKIDSGIYSPGSRVQMMAHNAYPDYGKYQDRLDRALTKRRSFCRRRRSRMDRREVIADPRQQESLRVGPNTR
jgi:hypothetical protein